MELATRMLLEFELLLKLFIEGEITFNEFINAFKYCIDKETEEVTELNIYGTYIKKENLLYLAIKGRYNYKITPSIKICLMDGELDNRDRENVENFIDWIVDEFIDINYEKVYGNEEEYEEEYEDEYEEKYEEEYEDEIVIEEVEEEIEVIKIIEK